MQEMTMEEVDGVSGGYQNVGGAIALALAAAWAGAVMGAAVGSIVPGVGNLGGAAIGFVFSAAVGVASVYATAQ